MIYLDIYIYAVFFSYPVIAYAESFIVKLILWSCLRPIRRFHLSLLSDYRELKAGVWSACMVRLHLFLSSLLNRSKLMPFCQEHLMELSYLSWAYTPVPLISIQIQFQLEKQTSCYCPFVKTATLA